MYYEFKGHKSTRKKNWEVERSGSFTGKQNIAEIADQVADIHDLRAVTSVFICNDHVTKRQGSVCATYIPIGMDPKL